MSELPEQLITASSSSADAGPVARASSFDAWYQSSFTRLAGLAALLVGSNDVAADLTQDAMVGVLTRWERLDEPDAYAYRVVVNTCRSYLRRRQMGRRFASTEDAASRSTVERHDLTIGMDDQLRIGLGRLREAERTALVLRFWLDLTDREIAEAMRIKPGTVGSLVHRGLQQLRESIGDV